MKNTYEIPRVEITQMTMSSIICVSGGTGLGIGEEISGGEGG